MDIIFICTLSGIWVVSMGSYVLYHKKGKHSDKLHYYNYRGYYIKFKKIHDDLNESTKRFFK